MKRPLYTLLLKCEVSLVDLNVVDTIQEVIQMVQNIR